MTITFISPMFILVIALFSINLELIISNFKSDYEIIQLCNNVTVTSKKKSN